MTRQHHNPCLIGLDVKPRRPVTRRNRYRSTSTSTSTYRRWLVPAFLALLLITGTLFITAGTR